MRLTQEEDYAFRIIFYLCQKGYDEKIDAKTISNDEKIPLRFLLKIFRKLMAADIVKSFRGTLGGYSLNRLPKDITMKDVIEAIQGEIFINRCLSDPKLCNLSRANCCGVQDALVKVQETLIKEISTITFQDILDKKC